jgi:predicted transcriptional regulator
MGGIGQNILREIRESGDEEDWVDTTIKEILERLAKKEKDKEEKDKEENKNIK